MAGTERKRDAALRAELESGGARFGFFRAVALLQRLSPSSVPVGEVGPAKDEAIRFVCSPELIFHSSDVASIRLRTLRGQAVFAEITANFFGLFGSSSPLATHISEDVLRAEHGEERSLKAFYDLFHHRLLSLLFRAWKKYHLAAGFRQDGTDPFTRRALSFVGVDARGATPRLGLPPTELLALAPLLALRTRPARSLEKILERLLPGTSVHVEPFVLRTVPIEPGERAQLGVANTTLGSDLTIGRSVLDRSGRFRVVMGPLNRERYESLMPGGAHFPKLRAIVDQFSRGLCEAELELRLAREEAPRFELGSRGGAVLGTTTTLRGPSGGGMCARVLLTEDAEKARPRLTHCG